MTEGALLRCSGTAGSRRAELLLEGDVCRVAALEDHAWKVVSDRATLALVTSAALTAMASTAFQARQLIFRLIGQCETSSELRSIVGTRGIEVRIASFFSHLARRVGREEGRMVRVPLHLEQKHVEVLVGAGHTQACNAFKSLFASEVLAHDADGWLVLVAAELRSELSTRSVPDVAGRVLSSVPN